MVSLGSKAANLQLCHKPTVISQDHVTLHAYRRLDCGEKHSMQYMFWKLETSGRQLAGFLHHWFISQAIEGATCRRTLSQIEPKRAAKQLQVPHVQSYHMALKRYFWHNPNALLGSQIYVFPYSRKKPLWSPGVFWAICARSQKTRFSTFFTVEIRT